MLGVCAHAIFIVSRPCEAKGAHGETDPEADAQMEEEPDIVADEDGLGEIEDVVAYIKGVTAEANLKIEKRVRQQVIQESHKVDGRYTEINKKLEKVMGAVEMVRTGRGDVGAAGAAACSSPAGAIFGPRPAASTGQADPDILRANTSVLALRVQVQEAMDALLRDHTSVDPQALRVSGPHSGRKFVMRLAGLAREGRLHIEDILRELRDRHGGWREIAMQLTNREMAGHEPGFGGDGGDGGPLARLVVSRVLQAQDGMSGGVVVGVSPRLRTLHPAGRFDVVTQGRVGVLRLRGLDSPALDLANIHLVSELHEALLPMACATTVLVGDFNFATPSRGASTSPRARSATPAGRAPSSSWRSLTTTRRQMPDGEPHHSSRLDHMYTNSHVGGLMGA